MSLTVSLTGAEARLTAGLSGRMLADIRRSRALSHVPHGLASATGFHRDSLSGVASGVAHGIAGTVLAPVTAGLGAAAGVGLAALDSWVLNGAGAALREAAGVIGATTAPRLESAWFSSEYWRVAGFAALLTVPFLFAAAVQAIVASDLALLVRAAFCYLPLALLAVALAAPLTMLLLAATDQMCAAVSDAGSGGGARFLTDAAALGAVDPLDGTAFLAFAVGALTVAGALALAIEMLVREAAVYVVVLMLPLAFAAFVWPARRIWAIRTVELLVALILSKFAIVAVLSLAGAAFGATGGTGPARLLTAMALVILAAFAPWGIVRLLPFTELASGAASEIRSSAPRAAKTATSMADAASSLGALGGAADWSQGLPATMADEARAAGQTDVHMEGSPSADDGGGLGRDLPSAGESDRELAIASDTGSDDAIASDTGADDASWGVTGGDAGIWEETGGAPDMRADETRGGEAGPPGQEGGTHDSESSTSVDDFTAALEADDWTWKPVRLGLGDGWPPRFGPPDPTDGQDATSDDDGPES
jgi:hypothetical protein